MVFLIVEFANQKQEGGENKMQAIRDAALQRLRPILMTSASTVLGLIPLAFATGEGANQRIAMGTAVVGGMLVSTFLTMYIVPAIYSYISTNRNVKTGMYETNHYNFMYLHRWVASTYAQYPYTLKKCLEEGLANNYSIRITRNEEQISHNNATLANAGYLPTVDLSAGYTGTLDNTDTKSRSTGTTASERNIYDQTLKAGLDVNWTLFDGFNISTTYKN